MSCESWVSWRDQRRGRENCLRRAQPAAWALYLGRVTVADAHGLSYYTAATLRRWLQWAPLGWAPARQPWVTADLVAEQKPRDPVLALPVSAAAAAPGGTRLGPALSVGDLRRRALAGGAAGWTIKPSIRASTGTRRRV